MKLLNLVLITLFIGMFISCSKDDASDVTSNGWKVTKFLHKGEDKTSDFQSYVFDFQSSGVLTAVKGSTTVTGLWKEVQDSGRNKLVISFGGTGSFEEISEDWTIGTKTDVSIKLTNVSGNAANVGTDVLEFAK
ncbi:MAG TPA: hypothetical protein PKD16_08690 [Saprospiraceae bacterium]|jgi:hypothetical protein|nr:hypothetical protein [Saprospiraceae bacterium]HMT70227.1 hypothetical protein [Saprospiraceae bacterium]